LTPATGYLNRPEATADTITADDWVRTGDIGRLDADGYIQALQF
jgi:long-subunit acyl-CoA synthetase (AMP-forming)